MDFADQILCRYTKKMRKNVLVRAIKTWFISYQRKLPWRDNKTPYKVLVSEIMLQQTQASVVIPYFQRWIQAFPTIFDLAAASTSEVIKLWEGLGYYSRARNLHRTARKIVECYGGQIPSNEEELQKLPGIGPYTVGAILSFAFEKKAAAIDGNVVRVLSRLFMMKTDISRRKDFYDKLIPLLSADDQPWVLMEGFIELGATVCKKKPLCSLCPVALQCQANLKGSPADFPIRKKRRSIITLDREVAVIYCGDLFLIRQEKAKGLMADLYEFIYGDHKDLAMSVLNPVKILDFSQIKHGFTHYRVTLYPTLYKVKDTKEVLGLEWVEKKKLISLPFSSGHRKLLKKLFEIDNFFPS